MQNIDVRFNATSNFGKVRGDLAALEAQAASLNSAFAKGAYASPPDIVDPAAWRQGSRAIDAASSAYRNAAASSGLLTTQQIRSVSETEKYTRSLQKQKVTLGDYMRTRKGIMKEVYNDQLRMQRMTAQHWGTDTMGRQVTDITMPKNVPTELDNWRRKMGMFGNVTSSVGHNITNLGKNIQWSGRQLMTGFTYPMVLFGAAAGAMAFKVEDAFGQINKVYDVSANAINNEALRTKELGALRVKSLTMAEQVARKYGQTVADTLAIEQELAATGLKGDDLLSSTTEVSRVSRLGNIDPAKTTKMIVALKTSFRETIPDSETLTSTLNFMNAASNATSLSLDDIAAATPRAASALQGLKVDAKQMTILLVSMAEAGIDSTSGANALKSLSSRIINPAILERAQKSLDKFGSSNINLQNIIDNNEGNLFGFVKDLGKAEQSSKNLTDYQKTQISSILAGANQFSRFSAILKNVGDAQNGVNNQTSKAIALQGESAQQLAVIAKNSEALAINNPAGELKKQWALFQLQLVKFGGPFLDAATKVLKALGDIGKAFMGLPDGVKRAIGIIAVFTALAGPVIMLVGLFLNLTGWLVKLTGNFAKVIGISKLFTKEEKAAELTTQAVNRAIMAQTSATSTLAAELRVLVAAYERGAFAARQYLNATSAATAAAGGRGSLFGPAGPTTAPAPPRPKTYTPSTPQQQFLGMPGGLASTGFNASNTGGLTTAQYAANAQQAERLAAATRLNLSTQTETTRAALQTNTAYNRGVNSIKNLNTGLIGSTAAVAGLGAMMFGGDGPVGQIGKMVVIGSLLAPAFTLAAKGAAKMTAGIVSSVAASSLLVREQIAAGTIMTANATRGALLGATLRGAAAGVAGMAASSLGVGLLLTGGVLALMHYKKQQEEIAAKQNEMQDAQLNSIKALNDSTYSIATNLGKAAGFYKQITNPVGGGSAPDSSNMMQSYDYYKNDESGQAEIKGMQTVDGGMLDSDTLMDRLRTQFIDLQVIGNETSVQARTDLQAMLIALGKSGIEAADIAQQVYTEYGDISKIDWAGPIADQVSGLKSVTTDGLWSQWVFGANPGNIDGKAIEFLTEQAGKSAQIFNQALASSTTPEMSGEIIQQYLDGAVSEWDNGYKSLMDSIAMNDGSARTALKGLFADYDVVDGKSFANAYQEIDDFKKAFDDLQNDQSTQDQGYLNNYMQRAVLGGMTAEKAIISALAEESAILDDTITSRADALAAFNAAGIGVESPVAEQILKDTEAYKDFLKLKALAGNSSRVGVGVGRAFITENDIKNTEAFNQASKETLRAINTLNKTYGYMPGKDVNEAIYNLENQVPKAAKIAEDSIKKVDAGLLALRGRNLIVNIQAKQLGGVLQAGIENVQKEMVDRASYIFDKAQQAQVDKAAAASQTAQDAINNSQEEAQRGLQEAQDAAQRAMQDRQEAAQRAMQDRQEAATRKFEDKWEKKKDALTKFYDTRVEAIDRVVKAEEKANDIRAALYEKEKKRLTDLADKANTQIDFDIAINTGNLDEAAKLQNNSEAKGMSDQMDAEQQRMEKQTQNLIDRLDKKKDRLENARDKAMKRLEKVEEKMRRSLEKMQEAQQRALQNQQEAQSRALQKSQEATSRALQKQQEMESRALAAREAVEERSAARRRELAKKGFDEQLAMFTATGVANKKQLEKALKASGLTLKDFGLETLNGPNGIAPQWGSFFHDNMVKGMQKAGTDIAKDAMWATVTADIAKKMLRGFGFASVGAFENFVKTGKLPKSGPDSTNHGGGEIGKGSTGRGGIYTSGSLHRSEQMVRAQKGEYVINRKAYAQNRELVRGINTGRVNGSAYSANKSNQETGRKRVTEGLGGYPIAEFNAPVANYGVAQMGMGIAAGYQGMTKGMRTTIGNGVRSARANAAAERRRQAKEARQAKNTGSVNSNLPVLSSAGGSPGPLTESALRFAADHRYGDGLGDWYNRCLSFVRQSLGAPGGVYDATTSWNGASYKRGINNYNDVPAGVPVYWTTGNNGHVILSAGGGNAYSTDSRVQGQALPTTISDVSGWLGASPVGWSADINGKQVYPLRRGGEIKYDNTLISAHKGETVLPARLTEQFKNNVRSGGGDTYEFTLDFRGATIKEDVDIEKAVYTAINKKESRMGRRRVVG